MRSINRAPLRLFFIDGMVPTDADRSEARALGQDGSQVVFRNARLVDNDGAAALEECDSVHGCTPVRYLRAFGDDTSQNTSGIGGLKVIHDGEGGVNRGNAIHLDPMQPTGDPVEEERRRAYRGPAINEPGAGKAEPGRLDPANAWGLPYGIPGAAQLTAGEVGQVRSEQQGQTGWAQPMASTAATSTNDTGNAGTEEQGATNTGTATGSASAATGDKPAGAPTWPAPTAPTAPAGDKPAVTA